MDKWKQIQTDFINDEAMEKQMSEQSASYNKKEVTLKYESNIGFILIDRYGNRKIWNDPIIDLAEIIAEDKNNFKINTNLFNLLDKTNV